MTSTGIDGGILKTVRGLPGVGLLIEKGQGQVTQAVRQAKGLAGKNRLILQFPGVKNALKTALMAYGCPPQISGVVIEIYLSDEFSEAETGFYDLILELSKDPSNSDLKKTTIKFII